MSGGESLQVTPVIVTPNWLVFSGRSDRKLTFMDPKSSFQAGEPGLGGAECDIAGALHRGSLRAQSCALPKYTPLAVQCDGYGLAGIDLPGESAPRAGASSGRYLERFSGAPPAGPEEQCQGGRQPFHVAGNNRSAPRFPPSTGA